MDVSKNNGTPKSSILIGFSIINHPFWGVFPRFLEGHPYQLSVKSVTNQTSQPGSRPEKEYICAFRVRLSASTPVQLETSESNQIEFDSFFELELNKK